MKFHILARALNHDCFPKFSRFECVFDPSFPGICPCSCLTLTACTNSVLLARCEDHVPALVHDAPARPFSHTMQQGSFGAAFRVSYDKTSDIARCNSPSLAPSAAASCPAPSAHDVSMAAAAAWDAARLRTGKVKTSRARKVQSRSSSSNSDDDDRPLIDCRRPPVASRSRQVELVRGVTFPARTKEDAEEWLRETFRVLHGGKITIRNSR